MYMNTLTLIFIAVSIQHKLPPGLLSSLCWVESKHVVTAIHHDDGDADSLGVCQVKLATAKDLGFKGTAKQLMNPSVNIQYSAKYLAKQLKRYKGNVAKAVISYNRGNARNLTTSKYQRTVFNKWRKK
jgi:hypothetical protein